MLSVYGRVGLVIALEESIKELLARGGYKSVCPDICDSNFPPEVWDQYHVAAVVPFTIFRAEKTMEFEDVIMGMYKQNCRGASLRQGLVFGIEKPHIHQKISLVLLGSFWRNPQTAFKERQVPELSCISKSRHVYLCQLDRVWPAGTFFLAVAL